MTTRQLARRTASHFASDFAQQTVMNTVNEAGFDGRVRTAPSRTAGALVSDLLFVGIHQARQGRGAGPSVAPPHTPAQAQHQVAVQGFAPPPVDGLGSGVGINRNLQRLMGQGALDSVGAGLIQRIAARDTKAQAEIDAMTVEERAAFAAFCEREGRPGETLAQLLERFRAQR